MLKRIVSIALAVVMVLSIAVISVSAAEVSNSAGADTDSAATGAGNLVYFDATGWKNFTTMYCHVWERGGDPFYSWKNKATVMKKVKDNLYSFDVSVLNNSTAVPGGLQDGKDYCIIFASNIGSAAGPQTYDTTFGKACIGDTAKLSGKSIENPVDSEQTAYEAVWTTNKAKYGPHLAITSIGNIVGSVLCPNESGIAVIGDWLPANITSKYVKPVDALAKAFPKFGIKTADDVQAVYTYIVAKNGDNIQQADYDDMQAALSTAFKKAYPSAAEVKVDAEKAKETAKKVKENGGSVDSIANSGSTGSGSSSSGSAGSSSSGSNRSGAGSDGQEDTILFILGGVMLAAAGVMFVSRRRRED